MVEVVVGRDHNRFDKQGKRTPLRGRVIEVLPAKGKVKVEGAAMVKRHQRANPQTGRSGGIIEKEGYLDISNVRLIDPETGRPTRVRFQVAEDGKKTRVAARSGHTLDKS